MRRLDRRGVLGWDVRVRRGAVRVTVRDVLGGGVRRGLRGGVQGQGQLLRARAVRRDDGGVLVRGGVDGRKLLIPVVWTVQDGRRMWSWAMRCLEWFVRMQGWLVWGQLHHA